VNNELGLQQGLYNAGGAVQNLAQQYIQAPQTFLQNYLNSVNQVPGQSNTLSYPPTTMQQLGYAQTGSSLGSLIGSSLGKYLGGSGGSTAGGLLGAVAGAFL